MRELNNTELNQIAGGGGAILGGDAAIGIGPDGRIGGSPYGGIILGGDPFMGSPGGNGWWIVPGELSPVIPMPTPEPGKP